MILTVLGGARRVTGSSYLIETENAKFLLDYGMFQGGEEDERMNFEPTIFNPAEVDFLILSHAHIDHSGRIPLLVKQGFRGKIYCTQATMDLSRIMLLDSAKIQEQDVEWENRRRQRSGRKLIEPLYTSADAERSLSYFAPQFYDTMIAITPEIKLRFQDAGHILGSAIVELWIMEGGVTTKIVFSGDLGMPEKPILRDPQFIESADYLIMESTYGNTVHEPQEEAFEKLMQIIRETTTRNGTVIIPAFSVGRTQELIYEMNEWFSQANIPENERIPIYVDSPMAKLATEAFMENAMSFDDEAKERIRSGDNPFIFPNLHMIKNTEESKMLNKTAFPRVIISASGMATAGRVRHHLKHHLWGENNAVVFVGYQAEGTLGRLLEDGAKKVKLLGEEIAVKARVENVNGFSGHADQPMLLKWVSKFDRKPKRVFLVHGEMDQMVPLAEELRKRWNLDVVMPNAGESFRLDSPCDSTTTQIDPDVQAKEFEEEFARVKNQFTILEELIGQTGDAQKTGEKYEALQQKLLSIQKDLIDAAMLMGK